MLEGKDDIDDDEDNAAVEGSILDILQEDDTPDHEDIAAILGDVAGL